MAIIMPGVGFGEIRGSVGAVTYSRNRGGAYMKMRVSPVQPPSEFSDEVRENQGFISRQWANLTQEQRDAWAAAAEGFTRLNRLGLPISYDGEQLYIECNFRARLYDASAIDDVPASFDVDSALLNDFKIDTTPGVGLPKIQIDPATSDTGIYVRMTPALNSLGIKNFRKYARTMGIFTDISSDPSLLDEAWEARFGALDASFIGKLVYCEVAAYNPDNGLISPVLQASTIIV